MAEVFCFFQTKLKISAGLEDCASRAGRAYASLAPSRFCSLAQVHAPLLSGKAVRFAVHVCATTRGQQDEISRLPLHLSPPVLRSEGKHSRPELLECKQGSQPLERCRRHCDRPKPHYSRRSSIQFLPASAVPATIILCTPATCPVIFSTVLICSLFNGPTELSFLEFIHAASSLNQKQHIR